MKSDHHQHIFFVDDEVSVRHAVGDTLRQLSSTVRCFASPIECLEHLSSQRCSLLISDMRMPEMDGIELVEKVKHLAPWIPILILTGFGDMPTAVKAIKAGANDFIEKPLDKKSFVRKVKSLLSGDGNHRHLGKSLTRSERRVLRLVLDGKSNKEIANLLNRSKRTVEVHRGRVMHKLGAANVVDLAKRAVETGRFYFSST